MASSYSTNLALELIGTGDQAGTWGVTTNTNLGTLIEQAISGYVTQAVATGTDTTITIPNGATGVARNMYIELTGTGGASTNLIVPSNKKLYFIFNNTASGQVTVKVSGQTGVSVPNGAKMILVSNGTDIVDATNYVGNISAASGNITTLTSASATITNLIATTGSVSDLSATVSRSASATITNLLATSLTVSSGSTLNGGVVVNETGADVDFRVESDTNTHAFFVQGSDGNVGIGTSSPGSKLDVAGSARISNTTGNKILALGQSTPSANDAGSFEFQASNTQINWAIRSNWNVAGALEFNPSSSAGGTSYTTPSMLLSSSGNLGLGVTPSAWGNASKALQIGAAGGIEYRSTAIGLTRNAYYDGSAWKYIQSSTAGLYNIDGSLHAWYTAPSGTAGNTITFTQAMTLDASGNLGVGTSSPQSPLHIAATNNEILRLQTTDATTGGIFLSFYDSAAAMKAYLGFGGTGDDNLNIYNVENAPITFGTNNTERARITSGGVLLIGKTATSGSTAGSEFYQTGEVSFVVDGDAPLYINRLTDDGVLVNLRQDTVTEGTISVSGGTVSYNAFAGSHWSQLQDGSKPDILRGTVMESINELCVWPDETNERLPKCKISDTAGSKKVYGVFMGWDDDWSETNDMYVTAVGAFICRVNAGVTVQEGDLLESNGDGTARVQADDIIRSSTIGKVTSTVKTHEYDDGSYCVPTVLYCG